ncbi:MAG: ABC transporter ATP-binding protein [Anaerolineales bacterium]|nr:ABC transporter ATP-binding protein [Anaerolineales bacterium]
MTRVVLEDVVKYYYPGIGAAETKPVLGLDHVSLTIEDGETVSIVGPSGCGKSTLLKVIAGLEFVDEGRVLYNNVDVTRVPPQERGVGMVFQDYALYPGKEGRQNMSYFFEVHQRSEEEKQQRLKETAELMGIGFEVLMEREVDTLSGGEKQRVGIARCIVRDPTVFLMDEPISNLDAKLRERTRTEIKRLLKRFKITTIYVTHDQQEAIFMGDRIAVMRAGRLEQFGTFDELYYNPVNLFVATLIGTPPMSILPGERSGQVFTLTEATSLPIPAELAARLPEGRLRLGLRPEAWFVNPDSGPTLSMVVSRIERLFTERAAFAYGQVAGASVSVLIPLDFPEVPHLTLAPNWEQVCVFAADSEAALHTPGVPSLF